MALALVAASVTFFSTMAGGVTALRWPTRIELLMALAGGVVKELSEATEALTDARRAGIFGGNAWDVYALPDVGLERGS